MFYENQYGAPTQYGPMDLSMGQSQSEPSIWQLLGMGKGGKIPGMGQANQLGMSAMGNYQNMSNYSNPTSLMGMLKGAGSGQQPYQDFAGYSNPMLQQYFGG